MLLYLGRRGAMSRFAFDAMRAASEMPEFHASLCISRQNENFASYSRFGKDLIAVDTFSRHVGALTSAWRIPRIGRRLANEIALRHVTTVIDLMPHVWSAFLAHYIRKAGARYLVIAHDAVAHPGDATGSAKGVTDLAFSQADTVVTLSRSVARDLQRSRKMAGRRIETLFHPILSYHPPRSAIWQADRPLRLLFFGRIMPYKGLPLFVDMLEILRDRGYAVEAGVFGEGNLGPEAARLTNLGAEVVNRWLSDKEISAIFGRYDLVVVSHVEASQSGVVAAAFGAGIPVVATPVGGLPEQVSQGVDGIIATSTTAQALFRAIERLFIEKDLYQTLHSGVKKNIADNSMSEFMVGLSRI